MAIKRDDAAEDERYWKDRLAEDNPGDPLANAIVASLREYENILIAIEQSAMQLKDRAQGERSTARQEIVRRHQAIHGPRENVETSRRTLHVYARLEGLQIIWKEQVYQKVHASNSEAEHWLRDVGEMRMCGVDMRHVLKGAHPDEVELLRRHENEARVIRGLWKQAKAAQRELRTLAKRVLKLLDAADGDDA